MSNRGICRRGQWPRVLLSGKRDGNQTKRYEDLKPSGNSSLMTLLSGCLLRDRGRCGGCNFSFHGPEVLETYIMHAGLNDIQIISQTRPKACVRSPRRRRRRSRRCRWWLLVVGCQLSVAGCRLSDVGCRLLVVGCCCACCCIVKKPAARDSFA